MTLLAKNTDVSQQRLPIRAVVELIDGELKVFPIADNDVDEQRILDALRFLREDFDA